MSPIRSAAILALVLAGAGCSPAPQADPGHEEPLTSTPTAGPDSDELSATVHLEGLRGVTVAAVGPPMTTWFPPPVPVCRPSSMNFSVLNRHSRASS